MARENATEYLLLGVLASAGPLSGYGVRRFLERSTRFFWSESYGQIYPALRRLERGKAIREAAGARGPRGERRYRISAAGRARLRAWLARPPAPDSPRVEFLLKLFLGAEAGADSARAILDEVAARSAALDPQYASAERLIFEEDRDAPTLVYSLIVLRYGRMIGRMKRDWAADARRLLDAFEEGGNARVLRLAGGRP